ncbi:hypothetical protein D3C75_720470 [compost metagenome]
MINNGKMGSKIRIFKASAEVIRILSVSLQMIIREMKFKGCRMQKLRKISLQNHTQLNSPGIRQVVLKIHKLCSKTFIDSIRCLRSRYNQQIDITFIRIEAVHCQRTM